jgi:hypothetical protein
MISLIARRALATKAAPVALPNLPYAYEALEPHISADIMRVWVGKKVKIQKGKRFDFFFFFFFFLLLL